jgi:hypothetical protein
VLCQAFQDMFTKQGSAKQNWISSSNEEILWEWECVIKNIITLSNNTWENVRLC